VRSVVFDVKPSSDSTVLRVEFEQSDISDNAYYGHEVTAHSSDAWQRVRLPIDHFARPSWASDERTFRLDNVQSLRFIVYEGSASITLDNLYLEGLDIGAPVLTFHASPGPPGRVFYSAASILVYTVPPIVASESESEVEIADMNGRIVCRRMLGKVPGGSRVALDINALAAGMYVMRHRADGKAAGPCMRFVVAR